MPSLPRSRAGLLIVCLGVIAAPLDTAVNIAFPSITQAFDLQVQDIRWVVIAYVLTYASLMLVFGRLGDLLGYRRIFQLGLLVSAAGFFACSLAQTYRLLLLGRMLQGVGIALTLSCAPALATRSSTRAGAHACSAYAAITAAGSALGPPVGGFWSSAGTGMPCSGFARRWCWSPGAVGPHSLSTPAQLARGFDAVGAVLLVT
jgi:MFS family permease